MLADHFVLLGFLFTFDIGEIGLIYHSMQSDRPIVS